jgi:HlyD family secretion protein
VAAPDPLPLPARPAPTPIGEPRGRGGRWLARGGPPVLAVLCGLAAWALMGGRLTGRAPTRGYAESITLAVAPMRTGRVAEVRVALGSSVKRGDELARLDTSDLQARRARLDAEREVARAKLAAAGEIQDASVLRSELWQLRTVASARQDQAELVALDREIARLESLFKDQLVRASDIEPLRRKRETLAARVSTFNVAASAGRAGLGKQRVAGVDTHAEVVSQRLEPLREQLRVAEAALAELEVQVASSILRAPDDAIVANLDHRAGEVVAAGAPVVTLAAGRPGVVVAFVPEARSAIVRVGDAVTVSGRLPLTGSRRGRIIEAAPDVAELPLRFRVSPSVAAGGRRVIVQTEGGSWLPGEEIRVTF